jgi:hypothetical protein
MAHVDAGATAVESRTGPISDAAVFCGSKMVAGCVYAGCQTVSDIFARNHSPRYITSPSVAGTSPPHARCSPTVL